MSDYDDHLTDSGEEDKWSRFCMLLDAAVMIYEEEIKNCKTGSVEECDKRLFYLFPRKTRSSLMKKIYTKQKLQNHNGASSSSLLLDLNKIPTDSETENQQNPSSESEHVVYDEEQRAKKGKSKIIFCEEEEDDNEEKEKRLFEKTLKKFATRRYPHQNTNGASTSSSFLNLRCFESSSLLLDYNTAEYEKMETKDPPNPDYETSPSSCQTENTSRKRRATQQIKCSDGIKKAKIDSFPRTATETPQWVYQVIRDMNSDAEEPRLFFEKSLSVSDVKSSLSRFLIPFKKLIRNDFLTNAESRAMENEEEEENTGVGTILVNQRSEKWGLRFKIWFMEKKDSGQGTLNYILNWGWNDVVKGNNLKVKSKISLWTFRCRGVLCFVLGVE